jgi:bacterioferritin-associated ferredoxin
MIVCSCRVLTDKQVRDVCDSNGCAPARPGDVHRCLGCSPECGRCLKTIKAIIDEATAPVPLTEMDGLIRMDAAE